MALYYSTTISGGQVHQGDVHHTHHHTHYEARSVADGGTVLAWLSNVNFGATLTLHCNKRAPSTGTWLLEDRRYISWRTSNEPNGSLLWCRGNPGSGKTILCSKVIEHLRNTTKPDEAVVYCFFDYARRQELTADAVLAELLVQLASKNKTQIFPILSRLYEQTENGRRRPTLEELTAAFGTASSFFERLFVVADALDECDHSIRRRFLLALNPAGKSNVNIIVFGRPHVHPGACFGKVSIQSSEIEIQPLTSDLLSFIGTRIADNGDLECIIEDSETTVEEITGQIIEKAGFSFLAAEMRLNAIQFAITADDLTRALQSGLTDPTDLYTETLTRIKDQHHQKAQLALKALAWLSLVKRPLTIRELCHALGIQFSKQDFSQDRIAPDVVLGSCFGLVIRDRHNDRVRLLHYTLLEFLEQHNLLEFGHQTVIETCLKCLCAPDVEKLSFKAHLTPSRVAALQMQILRIHPFSEYAAIHWFTHMCAEFESLEYLVTYLTSSDKLVAWLRLFDFHDPKGYRRVFWSPPFSPVPSTDPCIGIRIAVVMDWHKTIPLLFARNESNKVEMDAILVAILKNKDSELLETSLTHGLDPCYLDADRNPLLHRAVAFDFSAGISILAKHGVDMNQHNSKQQTPLYVALVLLKSGCSRALLECGAAVNVSDSDGNSMLHISILSDAPENLVRALLSGGSQIDARNNSGHTPLHLALNSYRERHRQEAIVRALLEYGSPVDATAVDGYTALHCACIWSWSFTTTNMVLVQLGIALRHDQEGTNPTECSSSSVEASFTPTECADLLALVTSPSFEPTTCTSPEKGPAQSHLQQSICRIVFQSVLRCQTSVDRVDSCERTPLHYAVLAQRPFLVKSLLQAGINVDHKDSKGKTALHLAFNAVPDQEMINLLLDHNANTVLLDKDGYSVLELAIIKPLRDEALSRILSSQHVWPIWMSNGRSFLAGTITHKHPIWAVKKLLSRYPAHYIDKREFLGRTVLHLAASMGRRDIVALLLHHGASVSVLDDDANSALHLAIAEGARCDWNALHASIHECQPCDLQATVICSEIDHLTDNIEKLLEYGADVDKQRKIDHRTALQLAIDFDVPLDQMKRIIARTRSINKQDVRGDTALHLAAVHVLRAQSPDIRQHRYEVFQMILGAGADVNARNKSGRTPLYLLAKATWELLPGDLHAIPCLEDLLEALLRHKPDLHIRYENGLTLLQILRRPEYEDHDVLTYFADRLSDAIIQGHIAGRPSVPHEHSENLPKYLPPLFRHKFVLPVSPTNELLDDYPKSI